MLGVNWQRWYCLNENICSFRLEGYLHKCVFCGVGGGGGGLFCFFIFFFLISNDKEEIYQYLLLKR